MIIEFLGLAILIEALIELFFKAAPLQPIRTWLINKTPWLTSDAQGHAFNCKYCTSVWIAGSVVLLATFADCQATRLLAAVAMGARMSNYLHILIGTIRDIQINLRLER